MPMSVRSFEEMTSITDMKDGTYSVKMRPNCNVCAGHPNKTQNWQRSYFFLKSDDSAFEEPPREDYRVLWNRSCVGHPTSPVYPEDFLKSVRAVALLRIYRWSEITVEWIRELKEDLTLSPLVLDSQFVDARILASDPYGSNAGLIDPETAASLHVPPTHPTKARREDLTPLLEGPLADPEIVPRSDEARVSPADRESSVRASELSVLNDRESDRED
ncbi:hypothetical protein F2Q69_00041789 [Brassica cretica]|uniref:Uncharacterized protein n=1 Tax=Brassica cretica TaxID=69181 RepID=A0A8S9NEU7_BRACR|nr:hypothetical protein F2Q69_00041789 [Brassica cretica]